MSSAFERLQKFAQQKKEQETPKLEIVTRDTQPILPNQPNLDNQPNQRYQPKKFSRADSTKAIAPEKDFTKVPNSVAKIAIPERLFKGMSKNTYDALYLKTRGAINPTRKIRATKSDLIRWTGVSDVTLDKHLKHLKSIGLVDWEFVIGSHDGNWYEVFVPEEINATNLTNLTNPNPDNQPKKVGGDITNFLGDVGGVYLTENNGTYEFPKTSLKTNTKNDDDARVSEAFSVLTERFDEAVKKLTGKGVSRHEAGKWGMLAELLILEMEIAASRTDSISSMPAFLTEVLRRKLLGGNSTTTAKTSKSKTDTVGAPNETGEYEIKPLDEKGREAAVEQLREFAADDFLPEFKKWYTAEDWEWIMKKLEIN